jgi:pimeloyl-ACP methyl ester carboxylesterase
MFNFHLSYRYIFWRRPSTAPSPLPDGIVRHYADTPMGPIEMLHAKAQGCPSSVPPLFFVHGGMGSAWVRLEYMAYLSARGVSCYAVSLRGHGESWYPSYLRMVLMLGGKLALRSSWSFPNNFEQHLSNMHRPINVSRLSTFGPKEELLYVGDIPSRTP